MVLDVNRGKSEQKQELMIPQLPELTERQEKFVINYAKGKTAAESYRLAGYESVNDTTIWTNSIRLVNDDRVKLWIGSLRSNGIENGVISLNSHMSSLAELKEEARRAGNYTAAIKAEELRGKVAGLYVERIADVSKELGDRELVEKLEEMFGSSLAKEAARTLGVPGELIEHEDIETQDVDYQGEGVDSATQEPI